MRIDRIVLVTSALIFTATVLGIAAGYRVNITSSLPLGLYRVAPVRQPFQRGDLITFTLPAELRLHRWLGSFTKPVAGLPGDEVCLSDGRLFVAGLDYGSVLADAPAHAMTEGMCLTVAPGEVFTAAQVPRSYDSRYFGAIPLADVQHSIPVLTWEASR